MRKFCFGRGLSVDDKVSKRPLVPLLVKETDIVDSELTVVLLMTDE